MRPSRLRLRAWPSCQYQLIWPTSVLGEKLPWEASSHTPGSCLPAARRSPQSAAARHGKAWDSPTKSWISAPVRPTVHGLVAGWFGSCQPIAASCSCGRTRRPWPKLKTRLDLQNTDAVWPSRGRSQLMFCEMSANRSRLRALMASSSEGSTLQASAADRMNTSKTSRSLSVPPRPCKDAVARG